MEEESHPCRPFLSPCSSNVAGAISSPADPVTARSPDSSLMPTVKKGGVFERNPSPSSSSSSIVSSPRLERKEKRRRKQQQHQQRKGVVVGIGRRWGPRGRHGGGVQDLALPLGMSFAAVLSQILDGTNDSRTKLPVDTLSLVCTSAVKESVSNIYGDKFDSFLLNFENSFRSTLKTLWLINGTCITGKGSRSPRQILIDEQQNELVNEISSAGEENIVCSSFRSSSSLEGNHEAPNTNASIEGNHEAPNATSKDFQESPALTSMHNQLILHGQINQELARASHGFINHGGFNQAIFSTFEKSVMEQTRCNDLKAFEIGLMSRKLQLKESQLALNSYANMLEKVKICMGISKATFKEQKLRNQMLDTRYAQLLRTCVDLLVNGLFIMSGFLAYGAYVFSYERITDATSSCSAIPKGSTSWWIPKPVATFSSVWLVLRCHVIAMSRMVFGLLMILAIAYVIFQRSVISGPIAMPVTFIVLLMGLLCGVFGKLCVDTLGGSGFHWFLLWEAFCFVHFLANVFPSAFHYVLYGPLSVTHVEVKARTLVPYWLRRFVFYTVLSFVYPSMCGLLPFASPGTWKDHFGEKKSLWKRSLWNVGVEVEV